MLKSTYDPTARRLNTFWIATRLVLGPFLFSYICFFILTLAFRNGSASGRNTACRSGADKIELSEYGTVL